MDTRNDHVNKQTQQPYKATVLGIILILFGGLYFAHQAELIDPRVWRIVFSWQMLLIALGILSLSEQKYAWGTTLIVVGSLFMYKRYTGHAIEYFWPILIIMAGLALIFVNPKMWRNDRFKQGRVEGDFLNETAIFGGNDRIVHSDNFTGGSVVSILGGSKIDLTECNILPGNGVMIELTSILGGSTLIVPSDWNVKMEITSILGGYTDKRKHTRVDNTKTVVLRGVCILGGGEIRT